MGYLPLYLHRLNQCQVLKSPTPVPLAPLTSIILTQPQIRLPPEHREGTPESWETSGYKIFANTGEVVTNWLKLLD